MTTEEKFFTASNISKEEKFVFTGLFINFVCYIYIYIYIYIYRVSQDQCARLWEGVPYVKIYRYNPKHLCPKLNGLGDNGN